MRQYDFRAFLGSIMDLNRPEMIQEARQEGQRAQRALSPGRGIKGIDKQYKYKATKYEELLRDFVFFLETGIKPTGISDWDFQSFRPAIEKLVQKGQYQSKILSLFETAN